METMNKFKRAISDDIEPLEELKHLILTNAKVFENKFNSPAKATVIQDKPPHSNRSSSIENKKQQLKDLLEAINHLHFISGSSSSSHCSTEDESAEEIVWIRKPSTESQPVQQEEQQQQRTEIPIKYQSSSSDTSDDDEWSNSQKDRLITPSSVLKTRLTPSKPIACSADSSDITEREIRQIFPIVTDEKARNVTSDVTIYLCDYQFPAHKLVLYNKSGYFRDIILKNEGIPFSRIDLQSDIPASAFKIICDYMYTDEININHDVFEEVLVVAHKLQVYGVPHKMLEFLEKSFDVTNVLLLFDFANSTDDLELKAKTNFLVTSNFMLISEQLDFLKIPIGTLIGILDDDGIVSTSELEVFRTAIRWLAYDWEHRKDESLKVMGKIRFSIMSQEELLTCYQVMERWGIIEMGQMKDDMSSILRFKMGQQIGAPSSLSSGFNLRRRNTMAEKMDELVRVHSSISNLNKDSPNLVGSLLELKVKNSPSILILGGYNIVCGNTTDSSVGNLMYHYVPGEDSWKSAGLLPLPWQHPGTAHLGDLIYICGGCVPSDNLLSRSPKITSMAWCFNISDRMWQKLPDMLTARAYHTVLVWQAKLYAIGGIDDNYDVLDSVECYDPLVDEWKIVSRIPNARLAMAACCYQDVFWIFGGIIRSSNDQLNGGIVTNSAFAYSPKKNKWWSLTPLRIARAFSAIAVLNGQLILVGGIEHNSRGSGSSVSISDVDVYHLQRDEWRHLTDLFTPRHGCSAVAIGRFLYVLGGISSEGDALCSVEIFDTLRNSSPVFGVNLPLKLAGMGSVVLPPANV